MQNLSPSVSARRCVKHAFLTIFTLKTTITLKVKQNSTNYFLCILLRNKTLFLSTLLEDCGWLSSVNQNGGGLPFLGTDGLLKVLY